MGGTARCFPPCARRQLDEFDPATYNPCDPPLIYGEKFGTMIYMDMSFTELNSASREQKIHTHSQYLGWEDVRAPPLAPCRRPRPRTNATRRGSCAAAAVADDRVGG